MLENTSADLASLGRIFVRILACCFDPHASSITFEEDDAVLAVPEALSILLEGGPTQAAVLGDWIVFPAVRGAKFSYVAFDRNTAEISTSAADLKVSDKTFATAKEAWRSYVRNLFEKPAVGQKAVFRFLGDFVVTSGLLESAFEVISRQEISKNPEKYRLYSEAMTLMGSELKREGDIFVLEGRRKGSEKFELEKTLSVDGGDYFSSIANLKIPTIVVLRGNIPQFNSIFLPTECVLVFSDHGAERIRTRHVLLTLGRALAERGAEIVEYMSRPARSRAIVIRNFHIGHHLWNELGAIDELNEDVGIESLGRAYILPEIGEMYADLDGIFPALSGKVQRLSSSEELLGDLLENDCSLLPVGGSLIPPTLVQRIKTRSAISAAEFATEVLGPAQSCAVRLMIGVRVENRCWIRQAEGYAALLAALADTYGSVAVVFDGHNTGADRKHIRSRGERRRKDQAPPSVAAEHAVVAEVRERLGPLAGPGGPVQVIDTIGLSVASSVVAGDWAQFHTSHWGAGLAKLRWISNLPGVVFSSRQVHDRGGGELQLYDNCGFRPGALPNAYLPQELISDAPGAEHIVPSAGGKYESFDIDIDGFVAFVMGWVRQARVAEAELQSNVEAPHVA